MLPNRPDVIVYDDYVEDEKPINVKVEKELQMKFLDMLKAANARKNKQAHRYTSSSKTGRQMMSQHGNGRGIIVSKVETLNAGHTIEPVSREPKQSVGALLNSKTDI